MHSISSALHFGNRFLTYTNARQVTLNDTGKIELCRATTKHNKARLACIYCHYEHEAFGPGPASEKGLYHKVSARSDLIAWQISWVRVVQNFLRNV